LALNLPERNCAYEGCRQAFIPKRKEQRFHSAKCRRAHYNSLHGPDAVCPHCGKPIFKEKE
jgi:hypothetical protein